MCRSYTIVYTNCGHSVHHPDLCQIAQQRRPITACRGWKNPMHETFRGGDEDCPTCQNTRTLRITQQPWTNRNNGEDVPIRLRRDSLSQRYVPTPPPVYTSRFEYGSGYGYAEEEEERRAGDPNPSPREVYRRIADWADRVPAPHVSGSVNTRRELEFYRPREQDHSRRVEGSSSRHYRAESQVPQSSTRRHDIYDVHPHGHRHPRTEDSSHSSYYLHASDEEYRGSLPARRRGYPPSLPSVAHTHDGYALSETRISLNADGIEVTRTSTWRLEYQQQGHSTQAESAGDTEEQNRRVGANYDAPVRRGQSNHSGSGYVAYYRGPQSPSPPYRRH